MYHLRCLGALLVGILPHRPVLWPRRQQEEPT